MATITGSLYSGSITNYDAATRIITISGASFNSALFTSPRIVVAYNNSNQFLGIAVVRQFVSATELNLESDFFDPITRQPVAVSSGVFEVSRNLSESGGWTVSGTAATQNADHVLGTSGDQRSLCLYDEGKTIQAAKLEFNGGIFVLGRPKPNGASFTNPCFLRYISGGVRMVTKNLAAHVFIYGGSFAIEGTTYMGGFTGSAAGSFLLQDVNTGSCDLISVNAGGSWGPNASRHVLRGVKTFAASNSAISCRWGDGVISGGEFQLAGPLPLAVFGSDAPGTYSIGAEVGERLVVNEVGTGTKPGLFRTGDTSVVVEINYQNVISPNRNTIGGWGGIFNENATGNFTFTDSYNGAVSGTKVVIVNSSGDVIESAVSDGATPLILSVIEAVVVGGTETTVESNWKWGAVEYGKDLVTGQFSTAIVATIGGPAKNVPHGAFINQIDDALISESNIATVQGYTALETAHKVYDAAKAYLVDNYAAQTETLVSRSGNTIDAGAFNVVLDPAAASVFAFDGTTITIKTNSYAGHGITTTGTITVADGVDIAGCTFSSLDLASGRDLVGVTVTGILSFYDNTPATYDLINSTINVMRNNGTGLLTFNNTNSTVADATDPEVEIVAPPVTYTLNLPNITEGSRFQVYNVTQDRELTSALVGVSGIAETYISGTDFVSGDVGRYRVTHVDGTTASLPLSGTFVFSNNSTNTLPVAQEPDTVYNTIGIDGGSVTKFTPDYVNTEVDVIVAADFTGQEFYAWFTANLTTPQGISLFFGGFVADDIANYRAVTSFANLYLDNTTATNIKQTDNVRIYRSDGAYPVKNPTSGGGGIDVNWRNQIFIAETSVSGLTPLESAQLAGIGGNLTIINNGVKKASLGIPHGGDIT